MSVKPYLLILPLALAMSSCSNYKAPNSLHSKNLKGRVKSENIVQISYGIPTSDNAGKMESAIDTTQRDTSRTSNEFDTTGNLLLQVFYSLGSVIKFHYTYDARGLLASDKSYRNGALTIDNNYKYKTDLRGRKTEQYIYVSGDKLVSKNKFKYDDKGNEIELANYTPGDTLYAKTTTKYYLKGDKIQVEIYKSKGSYYMSSTITYDANHDWLTSAIIEKDSLSNINSAATYVCKHSNYDKDNNWLREEVYLNGHPAQITMRTFEYY